MVGKPRLLLADEPTSNIDAKNAERLMNLFIQLHRLGTAVVIATHDLRMASQADRVLNLRDGVLVKETVMQPGRATREVLAELM